MRGLLDGAVSVTAIAMAALLGALAGFVYSMTTVFYGYSQGAAPLLANALGAAIGASITLWATERRAQRAEIKAKIAADSERQKSAFVIFSDLSIAAGSLRFLANEIEQGKISGSTQTAMQVVEQRLLQSEVHMRFWLENGMPEHYTTLAMETPHVLRILRDLTGRGEKTLTTKEVLEGDTGRIIVEEFRKAERSLDEALAALKAFVSSLATR